MYGFSIGIMGVVFICVIIGAGIGVLTYSGLVWFIYEPYTLKYGIGKPEYRLVPGIFAAALAPAGMFIFGYASRPDITWVAPTVGIALYAACTFVASSPTKIDFVVYDTNAWNPFKAGECYFHLPSNKLPTIRSERFCSKR
jgi:hypothetical protein